MKITDENLKQLKVLISIVPTGKKAIITDLLEDYDVNFSFSTRGAGTSNNATLQKLGLKNNDRDIIFSFIRSDQVKDALLAIEDKFKRFKINSAIAFAIPMSNMIGMQNYLFLSNLGGEYLGK